MKNTLAEETDLIKKGEASCVISRGGKIIYIGLSRGIKPIIDAYDGGLLEGSDVTDKVVGRAAAMVMALGRVKSCYAFTVSKGALEVFYEHNIAVQYEKTVDYIINRKGNGMCPMENAVQGIADPKAALEKVKMTLKTLSNTKG